MTPINFVELAHSTRFCLSLRKSLLSQVDVLDERVVAIRLLLNEVLRLVVKIGIALWLHDNRKVAPCFVLENPLEILNVQVGFWNVMRDIKEVRHELGWR